MNLNVFDFKHDSHETDIPVEDVESLYVVVLSGDELITAMMKDGSQRKVDAIDMSTFTRNDDFLYGEYGVHKDDLDEWLGRADSYEWFSRLRDDRL